MTRFIFILVAFSVLNQSIDLDYLTTAMRGHRARAGYDDVDSITELVLEQLLDDDDYVPDNDDDSNGMPKNNGLEKFSWNPLCCQLFQKVTVTVSNKINQSAPKAHQASYPTCKGYFNIVSPPPDQRIA